MVFPARTLAMVVLGSIGVSAWGQVYAPGAAQSVPGTVATATPPVPATTAVAAFPDVVPVRERRKAPTHELLESNPYDDELARLKAQENLFGPAIDEENPYAEQMRFANPYTLELRLRSPYTEETAKAKRLPPTDQDFENPYGQASALANARALEPDFENPYARGAR